MADKPKRRLRPPQTVREKTQQKKDQPVKPKRLSKVRAAIAKPFKLAGNFLGKYKFFRGVGKVLRFIGKILVPPYIRNSWKELKLVTWPNRRETFRLTFAVIAFAVVFGALVATLDYGLSRLFKVIILGHH